MYPTSNKRVVGLVVSSQLEATTYFQRFSISQQTGLVNPR